jgi:alkylhydroperoxidase domain protein/CMD domain protein
MTQTDSSATTPIEHGPDVINALLGIDAGAPLAQLRLRRPEATGHMQRSYDALFVNPTDTGVSLAERFAIALRVAALHAEKPIVDHYAKLLREAKGGSEALVADAQQGPSAAGLSPRLRAMLTHADLLVIRPGAARPEDLRALEAAGLSTPEIVTLSQVVAFVSFHIRVFVTLTLLRGDNRPAPAQNVGPRDAPNSGFTIDRLGWEPWVPVYSAEEATEEQRAVLPGQRLNSPYFRLLANDPAVLGERTATDQGIFYTPEGLPRAERELSAAVTSRVNGCVYCCSVHARLASQLSKRTEDVQRLLDEGIAGKQDERWRGIVDFAAALTLTPPAATQEHIGRLRALGLDDFQILDSAQATAFFAWANRLMLTLGQPAEADAGG